MTSNLKTKNTRIQVEILRSTPKAHLVSCDGVEFWIQAKWLGADSTITAKLAQSKKLEAVVVKLNKDFERNGYFKIAISKETEKAVAFNVELTRLDGEQSISRLAWLPKSQLNEEGEAPAWLVNRKLDELRDEFRGSGFISEFDAEAVR